jgi:hypothetical protein
MGKKRGSAIGDVFFALYFVVMGVVFGMALQRKREQLRSELGALRDRVFALEHPGAGAPSGDNDPRQEFIDDVAEAVANRVWTARDEKGAA